MFIFGLITGVEQKRDSGKEEFSAQNMVAIDADDALDCRGETSQTSDSQMPIDSSTIDISDTSDSDCSSDPQSSDSYYSDITLSSDESSSEEEGCAPHDTPIPSQLGEEEFRALSILSCFMRNKLTASACRDILHCINDIIPGPKTLPQYKSILDLTDHSKLKEVHYCSVCQSAFPDDPDQFYCVKEACLGRRYKGNAHSDQTKQGRRAQNSFVFIDVRSQLQDFLQLPGKTSSQCKKVLFEKFFSKTANRFKPGCAVSYIKLIPTIC